MRFHVYKMNATTGRIAYGSMQEADSARGAIIKAAERYPSVYHDGRVAFAIAEGTHTVSGTFKVSRGGITVEPV